MHDPPAELDGARVLAWAEVEVGVVPTGRTSHWSAGQVQGPAAKLALAQYADATEVYLLYCDADWQVLNDTCHPTLEAAQHQAEFEYAGVSARWQRRSSEPRP